MRIVVYLSHPDVSAWNFTSRQGERLRQACPDAEILICAREDEFLGTLAEAEIVATWTFRQAWFDYAPRLRWLATPAAGREYLPVTPPPGVRLLHGTFHGRIIGETVVGLMLAHCRGLWAAARSQHLAWPRAELAKTMVPLRDARVTILGYGHVGRWIGALAGPFGVRITGVRRHPEAMVSNAEVEWRDASTAKQNSRLSVVSLSALDSVLPLTDHLVLALPGGAETDGLLDARRLALLPARAALYNVGRGNAIDEPALADALREGRLAGAYLDVFAEEPLSADSPLRDCPRLVWLPHISAVAPNYLDLFVDELACRIASGGFEK